MIRSSIRALTPLASSMPNITEQTGDLFSAPANSVLLRNACNAKGVWAAGLALAFKKKFPKVFTAYSVHCNPSSSKTADIDHHQRSLAGTALLIPPSPPRENHWVACLFTSVGGRSTDLVKQIVANTERALADLARQIEELQSNVPDGADAVEPPAVFAPDKVEAKKAGLRMGSCWSVRLNSGKFGVEWSRTKAVLKRGTLDIHVVRPPS